MLAMADRKGRVWAAIPGLASRAKVSIEETESALKRFQAPDKYSRTQDFEGRRIEEIDGGWRLLNHAKYRSIRDEEERRAYKTAKQREYRSKVDTVDKNGQPCTGVDSGGHNAEAEAYAESINREAWDLYVQHRKELKAKKLTPRGVKGAQNKLATLPPEDQMRCVQTSIDNGWIGLFPEKLSNGSNSKEFADIHARNRQQAGLD